jgi:hypothetical protein
MARTWVWVHGCQTATQARRGAQLLRQRGFRAKGQFDLRTGFWEVTVSPPDHMPEARAILLKEDWL